MKAPLLFTAGFLSCIFIFCTACSKPVKNIADKMKGVKTCVSYDTLYDIAGQRVNNHRLITSQYDTAGNLVKEQTDFMSDYSSENRRKEYTYNSQGKLLTLETFTDQGQLIRHIELTYDASGKRIVSKVARGGDGRIYEVFICKATSTPRKQAGYSYHYGAKDTALTTYVYTDEEGHVTKEEFVDDKGTAMESATKSYTAGGMISKLTGYDKAGTPEHTETHDYNDYGDEVELVVTEKHGKAKHTTRHEFEERDKRGHWTIMKSYVDDRADEVVHRVLSYY